MPRICDTLQWIAEICSVESHLAMNWHHYRAARNTCTEAPQRCLVARSSTGWRSNPESKVTKEGVATRESKIAYKAHRTGIHRVTAHGAATRSSSRTGCPPGIRTPICYSRGSCPTIERGGNAGRMREPL